VGRQKNEILKIDKGMKEKKLKCVEKNKDCRMRIGGNLRRKRTRGIIWE
jgi:hypothetical protein